MAAWGGSLALVLLPPYVDELPGGSAKFYFFEVSDGGGPCWRRSSASSGCVFVAPWVTVGVARIGAGARQGAARTERRPGPRRPGDEAGDEPHGGRRQRRDRAPAHRARPPRRRPAAPRRAGGQPRLGAREARPRRRRGGTDDGRRGPRGGEVGTAGDPRPRPRHPPGDPRGPRPRRRPVGGRRPLADPGDARRPRRPAPVAGGRERGVLRRQRGADQRRPPRHGDAGPRRHRPGRRPPRHRGARRRHRRRRRRQGHRPRRACATGSPASAARCT